MAGLRFEAKSPGEGRLYKKHISLLRSAKGGNAGEGCAPGESREVFRSVLAALLSPTAGTQCLSLHLAVLALHEQELLMQHSGQGQAFNVWI